MYFFPENKTGTKKIKKRGPFDFEPRASYQSQKLKKNYFLSTFKSHLNFLYAKKNLKILFILFIS